MGRPANAIPHVVVEDCEIIKATDASLGSGSAGIIVVGAIRRFTSGRFFFAFFVSMNEMGISRQKLLRSTFPHSFRTIVWTNSARVLGNLRAPPPCPTECPTDGTN